MNEKSDIEGNIDIKKMMKLMREIRGIEEIIVIEKMMGELTKIMDTIFRQNKKKKILFIEIKLYLANYFILFVQKHI
jgi:hypothetical protein